MLGGLAVSALFGCHTIWSRPCCPFIRPATADGERFIIGIKPELPARPIHVVSDWRRELEE